MKWILSLLCFFPLFGFEIIEDKTEVKVLTWGLSKRETARIRLNNGLEAFVISDPKTEFSGATLAVAIGSFDEPSETPGLAHFLEHMLFLGTKTYPEEAGFHRFVSEGGGITNAYTAPEATCYVFSIKNENFEEGLDRFASFFKDPLFNPSGVGRELKAIDQEFAKNIENDDFRQHYIQKELTPPSHPFRQFSIGNSKTLADITQNDLNDWYKDSYSADLMRVVVLSPLPLNELIDLTEKTFEHIPKNNKKEKPPLGKILSFEGHLVAIEPIKEMRTLDVIFELPTSFTKLKNSKPERVLSMLLGHEGEGSLIDILRQEQLAETLCCGGMHLSRDNLLFVIEIGLTPQGLNKLNTVYERIFQALLFLKTEEIPPYLFEELIQNERLSYQYQKKQSVFGELMAHAHLLSSEESLSTYPEQTQLIKEIHPEEVKALLNELVPEKTRFEIKAPLNELGLVGDRTEKWMGCVYTVQKIEESLLKTLRDVKKHSSIHFPKKNPYKPENLSLLNDKEADTFPHPKLLINNPFGKIFFAEDTHYFVPKIHATITIKTPQISQLNVETQVMGDLFVKSINEKLQKLKSSANDSDLTFDITREFNGIQLTIDGLSDKAPLLLKDILDHFKEEAPSQDKFQIYKESLLRDYQNFTKEPPLSQCVELLKTMIFESNTTHQQKASALKKINLKKYKHFLEELFKETTLEGLLFGNLNEESALHLSEIALNTFKETPYISKEKETVLSLPEGPLLIETTSKIKGHALVLCIEDTFSPKTRAGQTILMQGLNEPFFSTLRTKQQTGYIVQTDHECVDKHLFNLFFVQSNTHDPQDLLSRFELFIEGFLQELTTESIPEKRFQALKHSGVTSLQHLPKNMERMGALLNYLAFKEEENFQKMEKEIDALNSLTYEEFVIHTKAVLSRQNKKRLACVVKGVIDEPFHYTPLKKVKNKYTYKDHRS